MSGKNLLWNGTRTMKLDISLKHVFFFTKIYKTQIYRGPFFHVKKIESFIQQEMTDKCNTRNGLKALWQKMKLLAEQL